MAAVADEQRSKKVTRKKCGSGKTSCIVGKKEGDPLGVSVSRRKKKKPKTSATVQATAEEKAPTVEDPTAGLPKQRPEAAHMKAPPSASQKAHYDKFVKDILAIGVDGLFREYNTNMRSWLPAMDAFATDIFRANMDKNRYRDIICNDKTRVVLKDGRGTSDYIHANYVKGESLYNDFICTQGPMPATCFDFWRMILADTVEHIVMLCECVELGKTKCDQYWPTTENTKMTFGAFTVTNLSISIRDHQVTKTTLLVEIGDVKHTVMHHHWKTWPDKLSPKSLLAVFRIHRDTRRSLSPVVVHCSAGVGRTGTFVAIEMCLQHLLLERTLNITSMCRKLREMRMHSVQVDVQYMYIAVALFEYGRAMKLITDQETLKKMADFNTTFQRTVAMRTAPEGKPIVIDDKVLEQATNKETPVAQSPAAEVTKRAAVTPPK